MRLIMQMLFTIHPPKATFTSLNFNQGGRGSNFGKPLSTPLFIPIFVNVGV